MGTPDVVFVRAGVHGECELSAHGKVGGWVHESGGGLGRLEFLDELREDALGAALGRRGHALLHRVQSTWRDIGSCRVMCGQGGGEFRGGGGRGGRYGDGGIDDGMPRHIGIVPPGARLTVIGHERVVRLDLVRALDERRDLTRRAARRTRGHHRAPMGPVRDGDCDCDLSVLARVESSLSC